MTGRHPKNYGWRAIAIGYLIDPFLGFVITFAAVLHEIPQGLTSAVIMREALWTRRRIIAVLAVADTLYPIGAMLAG